MSFDFNKEPYWDDYSNEKGFYKILFRPSFAVQTRELNQLQTLLQKQIERFGDHIFRKGSIVLGGQFDLQSKVEYVLLDVDDFEDVDFSEYVGKTIVGQSSDLKAYILATKYVEEREAQIFMIRYLNSNELDETTFRDDEQVKFPETDLLVSTLEQDATGQGSLFGIEEGVIFAKGYFINFPKQSIILDPFDVEPTLSVGFIIDKPNIVTSNEDETLLDNAQGTFNFAAPGAHRLILQMKLATIELGEAEENNDFFLLADVINGEIAESKERTQFSRIYEEIAKRTFDESGDYVVRGLTLRTREALDTGENEGLDINGDENKLSIDIEPGLAYVKGFEINNLVTKHILTDKGNDFDFTNNALINARTGGFAIINEVVGSFNSAKGLIVDLYDTEQEAVTNELNSDDTSLSGSKIGEARVKTILYDSGTLGESDGSLQLYLFDINMDAGSLISDVKSVNVANNFIADISVPFSDNIENKLIYKIGTQNTRKIRKDTETETETDTNFSLYVTESTVIPNNTKTITFTSSLPLGYGIGTLGILEKRTIFVSVDSALGAPNNFPKGQLLDLTDPSVTVEVTSQNSMTINLGNQFEIVGNNTPVVITFKARRQEIFETSKTLVPNVYVKRNYSGVSNPNTLNASINLGLPDVIRIKEIRRKEGGDFVDEQDGDDVTNLFQFDNGQRDNFYDHARIIPPAGFLNEDDVLLIKLDAFQCNSHTYFSVDSYPVDNTQVSDTTIFTHEIPTYISSVGTEFNLRDCLDFRPYKQSTASYSSTASAATSNPAQTNNFVTNTQTDNLLIPVPSSAIQIDYSFYLARRDVLTLDKRGNFSIVKGTSSQSPITPTVSENVMPIANIFVPPYPSISQTFARILNKKDEFVTHERVTNKRFTMRDISSLQDRIENLEYYNALSLLEKDTLNLLVLDEQGNDRFKNGFFADGFLDHSLGATRDPDYNISVDKIEQVIRPTFELDSFRYQYDSSGQLEQVGNLVHLPIKSEKTLIDQPNATTIRNVEQSVYRFIGNLELVPDNDTWVDETTVDKDIEFGNDIPTEKIVNTEWGSWETHVVGYNTYRRRFNDRSGDASKAQLYGSYNSYADALKAAQSTQTLGRGSKDRWERRAGVGRTLIETVGQDERSGIRSTVNYEKETQDLGNFVTDVSVIPYIRPQAIEFYASGIRPNGRHFMFFDGEEVTKYVRQYESVDNPTTFTTENSPIRANEFGEIRGVLFLPGDSKRFRTGTKTVMITDSPTGSKDNLTSFAENDFIASGLNIQRQNTILSTKIAKIDQEEIFETRNRRAIDTKVIGPSCIAYTFRVDVPAEEEGTFLTSIDLFLAELNPELGFRVQIRELNSGGNITQNVLPYSEVWVPRKVPDGQGGRIDNPIINLSNDGSAATNVKFKAPVFVYNETSYAIVISAENINPDTFVWISQLGEDDVLTQDPVTSRPLTGAVFTTNNGVNWDIVPQADLKVKLYRAEFETNTNRTGILKNKPYEFFKLENVQSNYTIGEKVTSSEILEVNFSSGTPAIGNTVEGNVSGTIAEVVSVDGFKVFTDGRGFQVNELLEFKSNGTVVAEGELNKVNNGTATIQKFIPETNEMVLSDSNGRFFENAVIKSIPSDISSSIKSIKSFPYSTTTVKPDYIDFNDTQIVFDQRGRLFSNNTFTNYFDANVDSITEFDKELHILSRSTERSLFGVNGYSSETRMQLSSNSEFVSPIVDISRANAIYVHNTINTDIDGEDSSSGGNLINKYITKTITLDDGQDAEDLAVFLSCYLPPIGGSDVKVWMKVKNNEDPEEFSDKNWIEMERSGEAFSSINNKYDFIELSFTPPESILDQNGVISYDIDVDGTTVTLSRYKKYAIKVGILGSDSSKPPRVSDLRAIALQK